MAVSVCIIHILNVRYIKLRYNNNNNHNNNNSYQIEIVEYGCHRLESSHTERRSSLALPEIIVATGNQAMYGSGMYRLSVDFFQRKRLWERAAPTLYELSRGLTTNTDRQIYRHSHTHRQTQQK